MTAVLDIFVRYMIPTIVIVTGLLFTVSYGLGRCLKYVAVALWATGEAVEQGMDVARRVRRETFREGVESI